MAAIGGQAPRSAPTGPRGGRRGAQGLRRNLGFLDPPGPASFISMFISGPHRAQPRHARDNNFHDAPLAGTSKTNGETDLAENPNPIGGPRGFTRRG